MKITASICAAAAALALAFPAAAQTVKIGLISSYSGPGAAQGDQVDKGAKLYMKLNGNKLPPGVKVELITRDDTGPNGDVAKRIAQELIVPLEMTNDALVLSRGRIAYSGPSADLLAAPERLANLIVAG